MYVVRRVFVLAVIGLLCMMSVAFAEEIFMEEKDGIIYYCGDVNYPFWSMGKRAAAVADLSSAYIADENGKWRLIGFLSFPVILDRYDRFKGAVALDEDIRECWFWQKMTTGDIFFYRDGRVGNKVEGEAFTQELNVYRMLLEEAELHTADFHE